MDRIKEANVKIKKGVMRAFCFIFIQDTLVNSTWRVLGTQSQFITDVTTILKYKVELMLFFSKKPLIV